MYTWIAQHPDVLGVQLRGKPNDGETHVFRDYGTQQKVRLSVPPTTQPTVRLPRLPCRARTHTAAKTFPHVGRIWRTCPPRRSFAPL